jgi:hypothetical protein
MWAKFLAWLSYILGSRAGVAQQKQAEQTATLNAVEDRVNVEVKDAADTDAARRERLSKFARD